MTYTWDNNGNPSASLRAGLLNDGTRAYTYDQANRLKTVTQGPNNYAFGYNGLGDRLSQTVNAAETRYALDPATGLTQVLADGTNTYLYGAGRIAQYERAMQYFGVDALGSVRQIYDSNGLIVGDTRYDPFGNLISQSGTAVSAYGFTGEWTDATGLEYLRARYYAPWQGRFLTRDVWPEEATLPMSYNAWLYVYANPVNLTDPSGRQPFPPPPNPDARDLTDWLVREMRANANSPEVRNIRNFHDAALKLAIAPMPPPFTLEKDRAAALMWGYAAYQWRELVKDRARWDFKHQIQDKLNSKTIMLCQTSGCEWFEYSVPGNVHYGYVGRAAGFSRETLHFGATVAEITDPAHRELLETVGKYFINLHVPVNLFCRIVNLDAYANFTWWASGFDEPTDYAAIELGFALYDRAKTNVTLADFQALLPVYSSQLRHMPKPSELYVPPEIWPYPLGYFNGGK